MFPVVKKNCVFMEDMVFLKTVFKLESRPSSVLYTRVIPLLLDGFFVKFYIGRLSVEICRETLKFWFQSGK
jgi:hypothetical protein